MRTVADAVRHGRHPNKDTVEVPEFKVDRQLQY